jgi:hypothetical protein
VAAAQRAQQGAGRGGPGRRERGSALTEAAIVIPTLVLLIYWSAAITDVLVLKIKGQEAARFALWETTVFRDPAQINGDVANRFRDLRSPATENRSFTGLMMYPQSSSIQWSAQVDPKAKKVGLGGTIKLPTTNPGVVGFINRIVNALSRSVDTAVGKQKFNVYGYAEARATLVRASHQGSAILNGGDLVGARGGNDLDHPQNMANFTFQTPLPGEHPLKLVYDSWKAWPKPAAYTSNGAKTNTSVAPSQTYATVEEQVSTQLDNTAFFGVNQNRFFNQIKTGLLKLTSNGFVRGLMGGQLPELFSARRMEDPQFPNAGPLTILPVEVPPETWAPGHGLKGNQRLGEIKNSLVSSNGTKELSGGVDRSRYTVPYKINSDYWRDDGGTDASTSALANNTTQFNRNLKTNNEYVKSFACRGHYFAGATGPQISDSTRRYKATCANR